MLKKESLEFYYRLNSYKISKNLLDTFNDIEEKTCKAMDEKKVAQRFGSEVPESAINGGQRELKMERKKGNY